MSKLENDMNEEDDYEDTESVQLLSQANKILSEKEITDENFKFFTSMSQENLMKIVVQLSKEKAEKLMNYLSKFRTSKKEEKQQKNQQKNNGKVNNTTSNQAQVNQEKKEYFNPSAPVWLDEQAQGQEAQSSSNPSIINQLLREHEDEQNVKLGRDPKKSKKFRMDPSQYQFEEMAKYHEKSNPIFPFYGVVAKVMYCYGDLLNNEEKAVEMMHSQIEEVLKAIFEKRLMQKLVKYCKQNSQNLYELDDDQPSSKEKFIFPKATKTIKRSFNQYFQTIFAEQFRVYQRFRETYQGIKEEGGFYKNNKERKGQKEVSSSEDSSDDENSPMEYEEDEAEDHQLREMKDHFDREDEEDEEQDALRKKQNKNQRNINSDQQNSKKKDMLFFDENDEDDDDEESDVSEEEKQETIDTLNQIEKIASLDDEHKKDLMDQIEETESSQTVDKNKPIMNTQQKVVETEDISQQYKGDKLVINEEDRIRFNKERTDGMTNEEWNYFMNVRSTTFTSSGNRKTFIEFLNINKYSNQFVECINVFIPFLSYCLCKIIGIVVEQIMRSREKGVLKQATNSISESEVQLFGNQIIDRYISRAKRYILSKEKLIKAAYAQFNQEFFSNGYDKILSQEKNIIPKTNKKGAANKGENSKTPQQQKTQVEVSNTADDQNIREQWKGMKSAYKKMWVERVISEKQIKKIIEEKIQNKDQRQALQDLFRTDSTQLQLINKYASYLYERVLEDMQRNWLKIDYAQHFKNWFLNNDSQRTGQIKKATIQNLQNQTKDQKRKMMKFESILD